MRNFKITIEYDGTDYFGWQRQRNSKRLPTVQGVLEDALQKVFCKKNSITASGRTDTGVHAIGQSASFKVSTKIPAKNILRALNTFLPEDIVIKEIEEVPVSFNARFSAKKKWYRYTILNKKLPSVFYRNFSVYYPYALDTKLMRQASETIKGRHDFSGIIPGGDNGKVKDIYKLDVTKNKEFIYIDIVGNGFLYKMARRIVGILVDVGRGKFSVEDVKKLISGKKIGSEVQTAPAKGLTLMQVYY